jgi:hypothetical protein
MSDYKNKEAGMHRTPDDRTISININMACGRCDECDPRAGGDDHDHNHDHDPGRPTHHAGSSDGSLSAGVGSVSAIVGAAARPRDVWPSTRTQLFTPFLFIRANAGDTAARPLNGVFWESPDIFVLPGIAPDNAPPVPAKLGGVAESGNDNTLYAHVWNLGQAAAHEVLVEFYWFDPTLGFNGSDAHLVGFVYTSLRARGERGSHRVVKCPTSWKAQYVNGGHECLVVRISDRAADPLSTPAWDASQNRHIGQRNIHVMSAAEAATKPTLGINVGPLFGQPAQLMVGRVNAATMPWLHLVTMDRINGLGTGAPTGDVGITRAAPAGSTQPNLGAVPNARSAGLIGDTAAANGDDQQVGFVATDGNPGAGNAHVYRVSGSQNGQVFGGYTVVIVG